MVRMKKCSLSAVKNTGTKQRTYADGTRNSEGSTHRQIAVLPNACCLPASRHIGLSPLFRRKSDSTPERRLTAQAAKGDQGQRTLFVN